MYSTIVLSSFRWRCNGCPTLNNFAVSQPPKSKPFKFDLLSCRRIRATGHPAIASGSMSLETFASLPHALVTLRRDATGEIDKALARHQLQRRIAITIPHMLVLPAMIATNDLVAAVPYRVAARLASLYPLELFELPVKTETWTVSMLWSRLADKDTANGWLRQTLKTVCETI